MTKEQLPVNLNKSEKNKNPLVKAIENDILVEKLAFTSAALGLLEMLALSNADSESLTRTLGITLGCIMIGAAYKVKIAADRSKSRF